MDQVKKTENPLYAAIISEIVESDDFLRQCEGLNHCQMLNDMEIQDILDDSIGNFVTENLVKFTDFIHQRLIEENIEELERLVHEKEIRTTI